MQLHGRQGEGFYAQIHTIWVILCAEKLGMEIDDPAGMLTFNNAASQQLKNAVRANFRSNPSMRGCQHITEDTYHCPMRECVLM